MRSACDMGGADKGLAVEALDGLCVRIATLDAASGWLLWSSSGFDAVLPGLRTLADLEPGDLSQAFADCRLTRRPVSALVALAGGKSVYDARLDPSPDGEKIHVQLQDAAERRADERRRLEDRERLLLTSRVLSVGEMASMTAHELNQPIGAIANLLRGLKNKLLRGVLDKETAAFALDKGVEQALYAAGVIARIRTFVDQRQPRVTALDLARLARETLDLLDWEVQRDRVDASIDAEEMLATALGDEVMIQQVLVNLARNALDAMRVQTGSRRLRLELRARPKEVEVALHDTGPGVDEVTAARMFQPFYSTKADGMGVGLGLCRSIVELHGGRLWHSPPGEGPGSIFHVALPRAGLES